MEEGGLVMEVNMEDGLVDGGEEMSRLVNVVGWEGEIGGVGIMIECWKWEVIGGGVKCVEGKCMVKCMWLKEGEEVFIGDGGEVKEVGGGVMVMGFEEKGEGDR